MPTLTAPSLSIGIEEEYLLVSADSLALVSEPPAAFVKECTKRLPNRISHELLMCQIEVKTSVCGDVAAAGRELGAMRATIVEIATCYGMRIMAAGTHPFSAWEDQKIWPNARYADILEQMQQLAQRAVICGVHIHLAVEDESVRIDLQNQLRYFLPHLTAFSCSSPLWDGRDTGLMSYRSEIFGALPRTGIPPLFASWDDYQRQVELLQRLGLIEDASRLWWSLRPSARYPTLELRCLDACPLLEDTLSITALYQCLTHWLYHLRASQLRLRDYSSVLIGENQWRAVRHGLERGLVDFGGGKVLSATELTDQLLDRLSDSAEALGCRAELEGLRNIVERGNSAQRQRSCLQVALERGDSEQTALREVGRMLADETAAATDALNTSAHAEQ